MNDAEFLKWYYEEATEQDRLLHDKLEDFADLFSDMLFEEGTIVDSLIQCHVEDAEGNNCGEESAIIPDALKYFSYNQVKTKYAEMPKGFAGSYDDEEMLLILSPDAAGDDVVILHEMIHLHEHILNRQPLFYHDALLWVLYTQLKEKIENLDVMIAAHSHVALGQSLYARSGLHDVLFLLKSYDLDLKMGYPIGTVFRYRNYAKQE